ncbi:TetR/AcrR family transcriptional regulator [Simiduia litorea]|uniref:TetR/AcrR family transcriptional regulator n=1 Tax=Simiduia litorea TaxID=1435348 RepID=UPI0036F1B9EF
MSDSTKSRRAKGEQTRQTILEATLRLIVERGHHAVTHRAVAAEAGVNLSLTTYYFKDLQELIRHAFEFYSERTGKAVGDVWSAINSQLDSMSVDTGAQKAEVADWLATVAAEYILDEFKNKTDNLILEMTLFYDLHLEKGLRDIGYQLKTRFKSDFVAVCHRLGSDQPEIDAALLLGEMQRLEYQGLTEGGELTKEQIFLQLNRLIRLFMRI